LLALMEVGLTRRKRAWVTAGGLGLLLLTIGALVPTLSQPRAAYAIGAKPFAEQYVLAALIEQRLREASLSATTREGLGSSVIFNALRAGEIDAYVDYSGTIWTNQMHRTDVKPRADVIAAMAAWLEREHKIKLLGGLGFENAYALAMPKSRAQALGIRTLADLAGRAQSLSIAGDYEFFGRPEWGAVRKTYGIGFREQKQMQPEFMYAAVAHGEVDVIAGYTSDGRIAQFDLMVLDDPKHAIPPYDAVLLISPQRINDQALLAALKPLVDAIDVTMMRGANLRASGGDNTSPSEAARWLWSEIQRKR
jgi:osmoprotectant transport system permease protein